MKTLRKTAIVCALVAACAGTAQAQIVTTDPTQLAQDAANFLKQIQNMKDQLAEAKRQYDAISGTIGEYKNMLPTSLAQLRNNLPQNWSQVYSDAMNSNSSITGTASSILSQFDGQIRGMGRLEAVQFISQKLREKGAYDRAMTEQAYNNQMRELNDMQALTNQIGNAGTQKQILDLQARIQTAQGAIHGEQAKLALMAMGQRSQQQLLEKQQSLARKRYLVGEDNEPNSAPDLLGN